MSYKQIEKWMDSEIEQILNEQTAENTEDVDEGNIIIYFEKTINGKNVGFGVHTDVSFVSSYKQDGFDAIVCIEGANKKDLIGILKGYKRDPYTRSFLIHEFTHLKQILEGTKFKEQEDNGVLLDYIKNPHEFEAVANELAYIAEFYNISKDLEEDEFITQTVLNSMYEGYELGNNRSLRNKLVDAIKKQL